MCVRHTEKASEEEPLSFSLSYSATYTLCSAFQALHSRMTMGEELSSRTIKSRGLAETATRAGDRLRKKTMNLFSPKPTIFM